jgi:hypothetical protein
MPLVWSIDPEKRLMTAVAAGAVTRADMEAFFDETTAAHVAPFSKLFDGSAIETTMGPDDMLALGVRMQGLHQREGKMGPLAIVLPLHMMELVHRMVGILAVAARPMQVFTDVGAARAWLHEKRDDSYRPKKNGQGRPRKT